MTVGELKRPTGHRSAFRDPQFEEGTVDAYMRCPRCGDARLTRHHYTYVDPVSVDRCERCMGIWLDDSELNAIIGEKKQLEQAEDPGKVKGFLRAIAGLARRDKG